MAMDATAPTTDFQDLLAAEYAGVAPGWLNTATHGLPPARTAAALRRALDSWAAGRPDLDGYEEAVAAARSGYARLVGVDASRVALASTVAGAVGLVAAALPAGAEVLAYEGDFSSVVQPFAGRADLRLRLAPLEAIAEQVRPSTALVAVSAAQSADGRVADLPAIRAAAAAVGARTLVDGTQAVGWLPIDPGQYDFTITHGYKWLVSPHGACFLTVAGHAEQALSPAFAGWYAAEDPWAGTYGPVARLAPGARRFDARPAYLPFVGAAASLSLLLDLGVAAVRAHDLALAARLRTGLASLGLACLPGDSPIVSLPSPPPWVPERLTAAGIRFSTPADSVRLSPHLHSTQADIDTALNALS
jgi:selenocysteine lyase/cysteine desulfurase